MITTAQSCARAASRPALLLRALALAVLLAGAASEACAANVSISSIQAVANEATRSQGVVEFDRDTTSGNLVVYFTLSGGAASFNIAAQPTFAASSSAALALPTFTPNGNATVSGTITIHDGDPFEQLVITPLDNSAITGDLPLVVTVNTDPAGIYTVVKEASAAQVDITEGDYQASVVVPAPIAYENTSLVGFANDPGAPRRGILRVAFAPITVFPGSPSAPGVSQLYLASAGAPAPASGTAFTISPTVISPSGMFSATTTAQFGTNGNFISFTPGLTVGIPVGVGTAGATVTAGAFTGTVSLMPAYALPAYDKALKVQFGPVATLPAKATGSSTGTASDAYYVSYKIGGSAMGSATTPVSSGTGWTALATPALATVAGATTVNLGQGTTLTAGAQVYFNGDSSHLYTSVNAYTAPGPLTIAPALISTIRDGDTVTAVGNSLFSGIVSEPIAPGTTSLIIENGIGAFALGDVFSLSGENAVTCRYVITSVAAGPVTGTQHINFRRYTAGTIGFDGVNNLHSALVPGSSPLPALSNAFNVSNDPPFNGTANLASTSPPGIVQLLVPRESALVDFGINPIDNGLNAGRQSVSISLTNDNNYAVITPTQGEVIIAGADSTASISAAGNAVQGATPTLGSFVISLTTAFAFPITVPFTITGSGQGVGQPGIDYELASTSSFAVNNGIYSVIIPANSTTAIITVTALPTAALGVNGKTVTLSLSPTYDYLLASGGSLNASATLSLLPPPPPVPQLSVVATNDAQQPLPAGGSETVGHFTISAQVAPVSDLSVQYALSGSAAPGTDYLVPPAYSTINGTGVATILAGTTSVTVAVDPNISPFPPYKLPDQATITLLPASAYILTAVGTSTATLNIDQSRIQVNKVTSATANGTYGPGASIQLNVIFSAPVTVSSGTPHPTLTLNASNGVTNATAAYTSGSGTNSLLFTYVVGPGDASARLDYLSSAALSAGGTTIAAATTPSLYTLSTTLPPPATTGSLYSNSTLVIDGAPTVALAPAQHLNPSEVGPTMGYFTVTCSAAQPNALTVFYALSGTAVAGTDIVAPGGTAGQLVIPAGQLSAPLNITPLDNPVLNTNETVVMALVAGPGYHLVSPTTATATTSDTLFVAQDRIGVLSVTANTPNGTYHIQDAITLAVNFSAPVAVTGTPQLALNTGATNAVATYASGSGGSTLLFTYTVGYGDASAHLDYLSTSALSATLTPVSGSLPIFLTLAAPGTTGALSAGSTLVIDGTPAIAIDPTGNLNPLEAGTIPGRFVVTSTPAPNADLTVTYTIGGSAVIGTDIAAPPSFTTGTLTGTLIIPSGHTSAPLAITPFDNAVLNLSETVVMTMIAGTGYHLAGAPAVTSDTLTVVQGQIGVLSVTSNTPNGTYLFGATITLAVNFSAPVTVTGGTPTLTLNASNGAANALASYVSGSGTSTLLFTYTVGVGDASAALDYLATTSLSAAGATIADASANNLPVELTLAAPGSPGSISAGSALVIDGSPAIAIDPSQHVNPFEFSTTFGSPIAGQFVVTCAPAPIAALTVTYTIGGSAVIGTDIAAPAGTFNTGTLTGQLTIPAGSTSAPLAITPINNTAINLDETVVMTVVAGAGYHLATSPAVTTDTLTVVQDQIVVTGVTAQPSSGTFHLGGQITILVSFSSPVLATGTPTLALNTGATNAVATLASGNASGSGTTTLNFTYVVGAGDISAHLDYLNATALNTSGISDASGNLLPVNAALAGPGTHGSLASNTTLVIDGTVPVVTAVSATSPDGTYTFGQSLTLTVTFSLPVDVSGTPELQLATGATPAEATYAGGNGTTTLDFTYVVGANDASANLDCTSASALTLNGGAITWTGAGTVAAALALPVPGSAGSLGANKALVINGALPAGKPPVGSISGSDAGTGGGCGLGSGIAGLAVALAMCLRAATLRRLRRPGPR